MDMMELAARALLQARRGGHTVAAPALPDAAAAYGVQARVAAALGWTERRYWKSGGPSREAEQTHAALPAEGVHNSPADLSGHAFHWRGIEAEVALRLGRRVDAALAATLDIAAARDLVDAMAVSIEIVDSRWTEALAAPAPARLADLQSHGALVLGPWRDFDLRRDWSAQRCTVVIGAGPPQHAVGTHSMGDPAAVLPRWLRHATQDGPLAAGCVVTTGTWCGLPMAAPGDRVIVDFEGIGRAEVQL
jgi:2-keto-4-pentenoate hydratase